MQSFFSRNRVSEPLPEVDSTVAWISVLSRIGYSDDGAQALAYVTHACPLCGYGQYVLLARSGDGWTVAAAALDRVS